MVDGDVLKVGETLKGAADALNEDANAVNANAAM